MDRRPAHRRDDALRLAAAAWRVMLLCAAAMLPGSTETRANGGFPQLARVPVGPYLVSAWTQPQPPRVGILDISVAVMTVPAGDPVLDAEVTIRAEPVGMAASTISLPLRRGDGGNLLIHHGEMGLLAAGSWAVRVDVRGRAGSGSVTFGLIVEPASFRAWILIAAVLGVLVASAAWHRHRAQRAG